MPGIIVDRLVTQVKTILATRCHRFLKRIKKGELRVESRVIAS